MPGPPRPVYLLKFLAMPTSQMLTLTTPGQVTTCLMHARRHHIEAASFKLEGGQGWGIVKLRRRMKRMLPQCPKCGYNGQATQ